MTNAKKPSEKEIDAIADRFFTFMEEEIERDRVKKWMAEVEKNLIQLPLGMAELLQDDEDV